MRKSILIIILSLIVAAFACQLPGNAILPEPGSETLFDGITYTRVVRTSPHPMVIHIVTVDLRTKGISLMVTPGDPSRELPSDARTTSQFLDEFGVQLAINGDGFTPWSDNPFSPYPQSGDPVIPLGLSISDGITYSEPQDTLPTFYLSPNGKASINEPTGNIEYAISGQHLLIQNGKIIEGLDGDAQPRTALGLNRSSKILTLVVVDGRQPGYSEGATLTELANILLENNVHDGINMDGGGSSTLVIEGENGEPVILNSPIDNNVPGNERPVANHLGIFARKK